MHGVTVRPAVVSDAGELARLRCDFSEEERAAGRETLPDFVERFRDFWSAALSEGRWHAWVAECGGRLVGNVWLQQIPKVPRPSQPAIDYGYVTNVYVEAEFRSRGVGGELMRALIRHAREQQLELLIVWPSEESVEFYGRLGFQKSAEALELDLSTP
jgi:GNAT superfamily N-acetyltransferase